MTIAINKQKKYLFWCLVAITGLIAVLAAINERKNSPERDVQQFEEEIASELPLGTHRDVVEKWITARGYSRESAAYDPKDLNIPKPIRDFCRRGDLSVLSSFFTFLARS